MSRVGEELEVGVGVHVDEPGADHEAVGVDHSRRRLPGQTADRRDPVARDPDVRLEPRVAGAVDDAAAANEDVEHR